ncbi:MAG TPA: SPOR domain-containing protein [Spirochaetota bacterium]|nr:SPOR domain-containing protein [Spirochaetota bacterium]
MENFDPRPQEVKEKSFYVLNLDTPRIIILTSVVIGIIAAAFLFGMSFMKGDNSQSRELASGGMQFDESTGNDLLNKEIPPVPEDMASDTAMTDKGTTDDLKSDLVIPGGTETGKTETIASDTKNDKEDVLKNENIKEIIPAVNKKKSSSKNDRTASTKQKDKASSKKIADNIKKKDASRGKSRIYEVSRDEDVKRGYDSYSVQVASYDTLAKAENEKSSLRSKSYDAYIDRANVNGRNYFRVKIGPVASKSKAGELLDEIQSESRYSGSYIVKD